MGLMGSAFVALTVFLLAFQPGSPRQAIVEPMPETTVTRVAPALEIKTQSEVLKPAPAMTIGLDEQGSMRDMTFAAISNLKSATTGESPAPGEPGSLLHGVVQRSLESTTLPTIANPQPVVVKPDAIPRPTARSYFVRPGDTLSSIALELYGTVDMVQELLAENRALISRAEDLQVGMVIDLP